MRATDMTKGRPARLIMAFALPMMAGNVCQQLYTIVDGAFVGRFAGIDALAAVGAADWLCWLFLGVLMGYTQGFSYAHSFSGWTDAAEMEADLRHARDGYHLVD